MLGSSLFTSVLIKCRIEFDIKAEIYEWTSLCYLQKHFLKILKCMNLGGKTDTHFILACKVWGHLLSPTKHRIVTSNQLSQFIP